MFLYFLFIYFFILSSGQLVSFLHFINIHTWHSMLCLRAPPSHPPLLQLPETATPLPLEQFQSTWPAKSRHRRALWVFIRARWGLKKIEGCSTANCGTQQEVLTSHTHNSNPAQVGPRRTRHGRPRKIKEKNRSFRLG